MAEQQQQMSEEQQKALQEKIKNMSPEELKEFQKQQCIFCHIVAGKVPGKKVYSDELCIAVMDIAPATRGHILLIPKEHYAIMPQVPEKEAGHFFLVAKYLSQLQLKLLRATGTTVFIANGQAAGQRSQHFMLHLIPRKEHDELLPIEEKVVDLPIRSKVQQAVRKRFNELMGIKEEPAKAEKGVEKGKLDVKGKEKEQEEEEKEEHVPEDKTAEVVDETAQKEEAPESKKPKKAAKRKTGAKKITHEPKPEEPAEDASRAEEGASLDDIARLFS